MTIENQVVWWTSFGAIAQAVGALATFLAVSVSLWVVLSERKMRATGNAGIRILFAGDGTPGVYYVGVQILNTGVRHFEITGFGWRTGWLKRGWTAVRHRYAIQNYNNPDLSPIKRIVEAGRQESYLVAISDMKAAATHGEARSELFVRQVPVIGKAPIRVLVYITGRKPLVLKVSKDLDKFLRTNEHANHTGEA